MNAQSCFLILTNVIKFSSDPDHLGLGFEHNGLLQAKLVPDKVTHTDTHPHVLTHIHAYLAQSTVYPSTERGIKEGGKAVHSS